MPDDTPDCVVIGTMYPTQPLSHQHSEGVSPARAQNMLNYLGYTSIFRYRVNVFLKQPYNPPVKESDYSRGFRHGFESAQRGDTWS
jgi:hypothetical protein